MKFSVIYDLNAAHGCNLDLRDRMPKGKDWTITESNDRHDYTGDGLMVKHRQMVALLDEKSFERFLKKTGIRATHTRTGGSVGAPGCDIWNVPAISFQSTNSDFSNGWILNAYVTPVPESEKEAKGKSWGQVRNEIIAKY